MGRSVTFTIFSTASSTPAGPTEQFTPITSAPHSASCCSKGAGAHVRGVQLLDERRLLQVQLVVTAVEEEALGVEHRAHGAVEHVDFAVVQEIAQSDRHPFSVIRRP